ncbi:MAG: right-handed parallel beta-helix repeat-containing protein [Planctomycetota bacterium]|jgi:hypothetical protein
MHVLKAILLSLLVFVSFSYGETIYVDVNSPNDPGAGSYEDPFRRIQAAIDYANDGDTVIVADGIYTGNGNRDISISGKTLTVRSENGPTNCIIDCNGTETAPHRGFVIGQGEESLVIEGFTIRRGYPPDREWAPVKEGGGILLYTDGYCKVINCILESNAADEGGAVWFFAGEFPEFVNCTFHNNQASGGSVISGWNCSGATVSNSIVWGNSEPAFHEMCGHCGCPYIGVELSVLQSDWRHGANNIIADPCFADANNADFHLKSEYGRWDPNSESWVLDDATSPAIDAGDPSDDYSNEPFPHGYRINIGAYGNTDQASKSLECFVPGHPDYSEWDSVGRPEWWCCPTHCHGDADCDDEPIGHSTYCFGFVDLGILVDNWADAQGIPAAYQADFSHSAETIGHSTYRVGFVDLQILFENWADTNGCPADCLDLP